MNRRKAIGRVLLAGIGGGLLFSGYKWYEWDRTPDYSFAEQQGALITALADTILPSTPDSPGAREAGVTPFILRMLRERLDRRSAANFIEGLREVNAYSHEEFGLPFQRCREEDRVATLAYFEKHDQPYSSVIGRVQTMLLGAPFFTTLKNCTVIAYCTSELGATKGLSYVLIPGSYQGCITKTPGQKAWATK